jgi:hypothetical protein
MLNAPVWTTPVLLTKKLLLVGLSRSISLSLIYQSFLALDSHTASRVVHRRESETTLSIETLDMLDALVVDPAHKECKLALCDHFDTLAQELANVEFRLKYGALHRKRIMKDIDIAKRLIDAFPAPEAAS